MSTLILSVMLSTYILSNYLLRMPLEGTTWKYAEAILFTQ